MTDKRRKERKKIRPVAGWPTMLWVVMAGLVVATLFAYYALPVQDGDLWFHLAYGRFFIQHRTLIPDHAIYSWTPVDSHWIYCAWIPEILLFLAYKAGGLSLLFALRYACLLSLPSLVFLFARKLGIVSHPLAWLAALLGVLMSISASFLKPEMFSLVFFSLTVFLWGWLRREPAHAKRWYFLPVIFWVWANSHGVFVFGGIFLAAAAIGELLDMAFSPKEAMAPESRKHFFLAIALCAPVIFVTPYGYHYPLQLANNLLGKLFTGQGLAGYSGIFAYRSTLAHGSRYMRLLYFALGVLVFCGLVPFGRRRPDWALVLINLVFVGLYLWALRMTYYFAPVFCCTTLLLVNRRPRWLWPTRSSSRLFMGAGILLLTGLVSWQAIAEARCRPDGSRWMGFGISIFSPVQEAEYIYHHFPGWNIGNTYNGGAYLLWRLWPQNRVMIDAREYPYHQWWNVYEKFAIGDDVPGLLRKFPCNLWCVNFTDWPPLEWFVQSKNWHLVYYGTAAAVFVKKGAAAVYDRTHANTKTFYGIRNLFQAGQVLKFALIIGDFTTAKTVLDGMQAHFRCYGQQETLEAGSLMYQGFYAQSIGDYRRAVQRLEKSRRLGVTGLEPFIDHLYRKILTLPGGN